MKLKDVLKIFAGSTIMLLAFFCSLLFFSCSMKGIITDAQIVPAHSYETTEREAHYITVPTVSTYHDSTGTHTRIGTKQQFSHYTHHFYQVDEEEAFLFILNEKKKVFVSEATFYEYRVGDSFDTKSLGKEKSWWRYNPKTVRTEIFHK